MTTFLFVAIACFILLDSGCCPSERTGKQQEMGIWDFISWSTDSVKGLYRSSYDHGSAAITKINKVVTVDAAEKVNQHLSDPEIRSKVTRVATNVAKNATIEGIKTIPGAYPTYKIFSKSLSEDENPKNKNKSKEQEENMKTLQARVSILEKEVAFLCEQAAVKKQAVEIRPQNTVQAYEKPEDKRFATLKRISQPRQYSRM